MGILSTIAERFGSIRKPDLPVPAAETRAYAAGRIKNSSGSDFGMSLTSWSKSMDAELRWTLRTMRNRCRVLYQNNGYAKKYITLVVKNVVGPNGIHLQNKAKDFNGKLDDMANQMIEAQFGKWGKIGCCDVTGKLSWKDAQRLFIRSVATDGEVIVRKVRNFGNPYKFALQFLEADHLDENYNGNHTNGNQIRMGIEYDQWDRAIAYHILVQHPGDYTYARSGGNYYERIPAADIIHAYLPERARQGRGVPWMHAAVDDVDNMGAYVEAAIISKRTSASRMGFLVPPDTETGTLSEDGETVEGDLISKLEAGTLEQLPAGYKFEQFNPAEPGGDFDPFMARTLKGFASALDISYHHLASDLSGVNYTSSRTGELSDRDTWRTIQDWMIETFNENIFCDWLEVQLLAGLLTFNNGNVLPYSKFDKFCAPNWVPRGWTWVDPLKDINASIRALEFGLTTRTRISAECGDDYLDLLDEMQQEAKAITDRSFEVQTTFNGSVKEAPVAVEVTDPQDELASLQLAENTKALEAKVDRMTDEIRSHSTRESVPSNITVNNPPITANINMPEPAKRTIRKTVTHNRDQITGEIISSEVVEQEE
jgi:lambda family phage portal protein